MGAPGSQLQPPGSGMLLSVTVIVHFGPGSRGRGLSVQLATRRIIALLIDSLVGDGICS